MATTGTNPKHLIELGGLVQKAGTGRGSPTTIAPYSMECFSTQHARMRDDDGAPSQRRCLDDVVHARSPTEAEQAAEVSARC